MSRIPRAAEREALPPAGQVGCAGSYVDLHAIASGNSYLLEVNMIAP